MSKTPDWTGPVETTPEDDQWSLAMAPPHLKAHYAERLALDPETRKLEFQARKAEADAKAMAEAAAVTDKVIEQKQIEERIVDKQIEKEKVKRGLSTGAPSGPRKLVGRPLGTVQPRAIQWLWTGWVPKGYITLLAGETGAGKTTVLADIVARVTTGAPWPGPTGINGQWRKPARVLWLGSEDGIEEMTVPRLMAGGANLDNVIEIQGAIQQGTRNTFSMQDDIESVSEWLTFAELEGNPFAMLVIDPVTSYLPGQKLRKVDMNDAGQLRTVLEPWLILAQKHRIAIVCVTHFAKDTTRAMLHRVLGSAAFAQTCRSLIAVIEPPATDDYEPGPYEKAMLQVKVNLPEHPGGAWRFNTERIEVGTDAEYGTPIPATRAVWDELDHTLTPKTAVGPARGPKSKSELPFAIWVKAVFTTPGGWLRVDHAMATAMRDGACPSESWWNKHSGEYLDKQNINGTWWCRPKDGGAQAQG